eukprot:TRINITY_DN58950_c0_g1_i1.p1 TRINITY_DN58950_c0_g1~~TRINITY_DN58950_c0_g1_i1.p1  ORF type:complete len:154 (+),score=17.86 TRINITY_DN58950_c0_g1_i1:62-523(+)
MVACVWARCFRKWKGVEYDEEDSVRECLFCDFARGKVGYDGSVKPLLFEDEVCSVFESRAKDARTHLLIVPKFHIKDCKSDGAAELVPHFVQVAERLSPGATCCFHVPPFNSIDHLHMHVLVPPYRNCLKMFKHEPAWWKLWTIGAMDLHSRM